MVLDLNEPAPDEMDEDIPFGATSGGNETGQTGQTSGTENVTGATVSSEDSGGEEEVESTPEIVAPVKPFLGMKFDSWQEAKIYYNNYAHKIGFSIRISSSRKSVLDDERDKQLFICNKAGKNEEGKVPPVKLRNRLITKRFSCQAKLRVKRIGERWEVTQFVEEHTHECIEKFALKKYMRSHKNIPKIEMDFIDLLRGVNLSAGRIMQIMSELYGSQANVPYDTKKISNYAAKHNELHRHIDIPELLTYFEELKEKDPRFFYKYKLDKESRVENLFWVDGPAREAYKLYHDIISFDSTYLTNLYKMPCSPFVGINRYGQTIQFGCGFLRNEKIENYVWLFRMFLEAMDGLQPLNIITDQDQAMRTAILAVFIYTILRNYRWHIMQKLQQEVGPFIAQHEELRRDFNEIVDYSLSPEEFETRWAEMVVKHDIAEHKQFTDLYAIRDHFVPAYFMGRFYPFLQTTSRSEGFNAVLKKYCRPHGSLVDFFNQYMKLQENIDCTEDHNEFLGEDKTMRVWSDWPMEAQMLSTYTLPIFSKFQEELRKTTCYNVGILPNGTYELSPITGYCFGYGRRNYIVTADVSQQLYNCQCCKFSRDGILCCHIMRVMAHVGAVLEMPQRYILPRWCIPPPDVVIPEPIQVPEVTKKMSRKDVRLLRYGNLTNQFAKLAVGAVSSEKTNEVAQKHLRALEAELDEMKKAAADALKQKNKKKLVQEEAEVPDAGNPNADANQQEAPTTSNPTAEMNKTARDPPKTVTKGRPGEKRKKSGLHLKSTKKKLK